MHATYLIFNKKPRRSRLVSKMPSGPYKLDRQFWGESLPSGVHV